MKKKIKGFLQSLSKFFRFFYRLFYANVVVFYKKLHCAAINKTCLDKYFLSHEYNNCSFYPTLLRKNPRKAARIYRRIVSFDDNGIPWVKGFEQKYWPVTIIQFGLLSYNFYLSYEKKEYLDNVKAVCDWLIKNIEDDGKILHKVVYHSSITNEDILPPYCSAMVQGEAISLLVRGFHLFNNKNYLEYAQKALSPFNIPTNDGGVMETIGAYSFYEEYPTPTPSHVLNGFIFSLFGLFDLSKEDCGSAKDAKILFEKGVNTLNTFLPLYDGGFCSRYDLSHFTCAPNNSNMNPFYHFIHINQLIALNSFIKSSTITYYINLWK